MTSQELKNTLRDIDHKSYPAYKALRGSYSFNGYTLNIEHVHGDPFAAPSQLSIHVPLSTAGYPEYCTANPTATTALCDFLLRSFCTAVQHYSFQAKGSGKSGLIEVSHPGQELLERSDCEIAGDKLIVRFFVGFPANGRNINAGELDKIIFTFLPECVEKGLLYKNLNADRLKKWIYLAEDQAEIRRQLTGMSLAAFVADGSILPRESGISQKPMKSAVAFFSPGTLRVKLNLPHHGEISGMGIKKGITLIVGGGYHGKSTLLNALELGIYDHIAGDGREYVITDNTAIKLRAEDGRFIKDVDISLFINDLPNKKDTHSFCTEDASGSTSQAAGVIEGIESGTSLFLIDEDTCATNFMVRDAFMQRVISSDKEPITPFTARARELYEKSGSSTILVAGSSGAFFHIADTIIQMDNYNAVDITDRVKSIAAEFPLPRDTVSAYTEPADHRIMTKDPQGAPKRRDYRTGAVKQNEPDTLKVKLLSRDSFLIGKQTMDLRYVEQLIDSEQTAALSMLLKYTVEHLIDGKRTVMAIVDELYKLYEKNGFSVFMDGRPLSGGYAMPRRQELAACLNRYRRA